jgi:hypothetical protein
MKLLPVLLLKFILLKYFVKASVVNDRCVNALPIAIGSTVTVDMTDATVDSADVSNNCLDDSPPYYPGVWYTLRGTGQRLVLRSCLYSSTSISIYKGACGATNLQCVSGKYYTCEPERFFLNTEQGTTYYIMVQSDVDVVVDLSIFVAPPVENDFCTNALPLTIGSTVYANTTYATTDNVDVSNNCIDGKAPNHPGLWYTLEGTGERLNMKSCDVPDGYDTAFSIFEGGCGATNLECVTGAWNLCDREGLFMDTRAGTTYHVLIQSDADVNVDFTVSLAPPAPPCGLFGLGIFCPCSFQGFFGRLIGLLFGC